MFLDSTHSRSLSLTHTHARAHRLMHIVGASNLSPGKNADPQTSDSIIAYVVAHTNTQSFKRIYGLRNMLLLHDTYHTLTRGISIGAKAKKKGFGTRT